jgi:hypothetical protein
MCHLVGPVAVIGEEQQPGSGYIQAPYIQQPRRQLTLQQENKRVGVPLSAGVCGREPVVYVVRLAVVYASSTHCRMIGGIAQHLDHLAT